MNTFNKVEICKCGHGTVHHYKGYWRCYFPGVNHIYRNCKCNKFELMKTITGDRTSIPITFGEDRQ